MKSFDSTYIEITNRCNLKCSFCPGTSRRGEFMSPEIFEQILGELQGKTRFIFFHLMGEPLLHPQLDLFLELSHRCNHQVNITTNGTLLEKNRELLKRAPALRQVNVSLHSLEESKDEKYIEDYLENLFRFIRETQNRENYYITLRLWNMDEKGFNPGNRLVAHGIEREFGLDYSITETAATYKGLRLGKNIFLNHDTSFRWPDLQGPLQKEEGFCFALRKQLGILVDGSVVPCCLDSEGTITLGNIRETSLAEILKGKRAVDLYEGFSRRKTTEELCRRCGYRSLFKRDQ